MKRSKKYSVEAAARSSPLSRAQVEEIACAMDPIEFRMHWVETRGDKDKLTSLRTLDRTDFFTRELDEMVLQKKVEIAIHSAKDLPEPLPRGLCIALLTKGIDPRDCLVLRDGEVLKENMKIGTSSERREMAVKSIVSAHFVDIRGTIEERLEVLKRNEVDGVVIAAAALLRLKLNVNAIYLPGPTAPGQGKLAIVCRDDDEKILQLFACPSSI